MNTKALILPQPEAKPFTRARPRKRVMAQLAKTLQCDISAVGNTFVKELVKVGTYYDADNKKMTFTSRDLREWTRETNRYIDNGNVPSLPIEHTINPEANRGKLLRVRFGKNAMGQDAIFGLIKFRDKEAEKLATSVDTSVYVESNYKDGKGIKYSNVITHVALTNYPVVSGLEGFEFVQLSLSKTKKKESDNMASDLLTNLAKSVNVRVMANDDDEKLSQRIAKKFGALEKKAAAFEKPDDEDDEDDEGDDEDKKGAGKKGKAASKPPKTETPKPQKPPKAMLSLMRDNRVMKLSNLVESGKITQAVADQVEEQYCSDNALAVACSLDNTGDDGFDFLISTMEENDPVELSREQTRSQAVRLSKPGSEEEAAQKSAVEHRDNDIARRREAMGLKD